MYAPSVRIRVKSTTRPEMSSFGASKRNRIRCFGTAGVPADRSDRVHDDDDDDGGRLHSVQRRLPRTARPPRCIRSLKAVHLRQRRRTLPPARPAASLCFRQHVCAAMTCVVRARRGRVCVRGGFSRVSPGHGRVTFPRPARDSTGYGRTPRADPEPFVVARARIL